MTAEGLHLLDCMSFAQWQALQQHQHDTKRTALLALLGELWQDELTDHERAVLQGLHLAGKNEAAVARELGLHHSAVGRIRRGAQGKLRRALNYAIRYGELLQQHDE